MVENRDHNEEQESAPEPLRGEEALALAHEGKGAWNAWARKIRGGRYISGRSISPLGQTRVFPLKASYSLAKRILMEPSFGLPISKERF
jgi:hypothetical protein